MNDSNVSLHIVAWNSMVYLPSLFKSLDAQTLAPRILIVDNASTDGVISWFSTERPTVGTLRNMRNQGFSRAHNQAIQLALSAWQDTDLSHKYIVVCNPDIEFDETCIERLVHFMEAHSEMDAVSPKLLRAHLRIDAGGQTETERTDIIDAAGLVMTKARRSYDRGAGEQDKGQYDDNVEVFGASGACVLMRASSVVRASEDGQLFDEAFHAYQEDVDLAWRMRRMGMRTIYVPSAVAWHHRRIQSRQKYGWLGAFIARRRKPAFVNFLSTRNHVWLLVKHLSWAELAVHSPWIVTYEVCKAIAAITSWSAIKGYFAALGGLKHVLAQRKRLTAICSVSARDMRAWFV